MHGRSHSTNPLPSLCSSKLRPHRWTRGATLRTGKPTPHPAPERLEDASASPISPVPADLIINKHPKEKRDRRLLLALLRSRGRRDNANVEEELGQRSDNDNCRDGLIELLQVSRKPITGRQERDLEHDGEADHRDIETLCHHLRGHLPMSMLAYGTTAADGFADVDEVLSRPFLRIWLLPTLEIVRNVVRRFQTRKMSN